MASTPRVTIRDVAAASGVSVSTVSNLLNGRVGLMTPLTRVRIEQAMRDLSYRPSHAARTLNSKKTATIGLVLDEIETPLFMSAIPAIEPMARRAGYTLIVTHAASADEHGSVGLLLQQDVEAVVFVSTSEYRDGLDVDQLTREGVPTVIINRPQVSQIVSRVAWDNRGGVGSAVRHLHQLGHTRIALLRGPLNRESTAQRLAGYREGLASAGLPFESKYVDVGDYTAVLKRAAGRVAHLLNMDPRPTAVIAADDAVAAVVIQTAASLGLRVPDDLSVIGVDDQPFAAVLTPPLTTVRLPVAEAASCAFDLLFARISDPNLPPEEVMLPAPLIVRESCAPPGVTVR